MSETIYDTIGRGYAEVRQPDPRIATRIEAALSDCASVVNVGAGAGSYEPGDRDVTAVEPSGEMIAQRPSGAPTVVQANAEDLPFEDHSFDAAMAVLSVHHFVDMALGLREMQRVARRRLVIVTLDSTVDVWAHDYWPELGLVARATLPSIEDLLGALPNARAEIIRCPRDCRDGFYLTFWDRPELLLDPEVRRGSSAFHEVSLEAAARGLRRLRADLASGEWESKYGLRQQAELDIGLRLIVSELGEPDPR
jgi:SAM-dependent methyltransferase